MPKFSVDVAVTTRETFKRVVEAECAAEAHRIAEARVRNENCFFHKRHTVSVMQCHQVSKE